MKEIKLSQGKVAIVDDADYEWLSKFKWSAFRANQDGSRYYAFRKCMVRRKIVMMHREILDAPKGRSVDHIDHNGLNNCRSNIRLVTSGENSRNVLMSSRNKSGVIGVIWLPKKKIWQADICFNGKQIRLGVRKNKDDAIKLRKDAEILYGFHENHGKKLEEIVTVK